MGHLLLDHTRLLVRLRLLGGGKILGAIVNDKRAQLPIAITGLAEAGGIKQQCYADREICFSLISHL